ncbi:MAG: ABC transporter permease [Clostridiaceae bacterium]|nr:ABC transporter permease [Clostridiaceae bacterium]
MLRRILAVTMRDLRSGMRDAMIPYILIAPLLVAVLFKLFVPGVGSTVINVAMPETAEPAFAEYVERYGEVELLEDRDAIVKRVQAMDDLFGIVPKADGGYELIAAGDELTGTVEMVQSVLSSWQNPDLEPPVELKISDMGWELSPLARFGTNFLVVFMSVFGGMIVMLNLVEEKQYNTMAAINVSAIRRWEYVLGKALPGLILPILHAFAVLVIMGFTEVDYLQVAVVAFAIALISMIIGFVVGVYQSEPIGAVASMKILFLPIMASVFGAIFLPEKWQPVLYWSPFYWAYRSVDDIVLQQAAWSDIWLHNLIIIAITALVFALMHKRIKQGMRA